MLIIMTIVFPFEYQPCNQLFGKTARYCILQNKIDKNSIGRKMLSSYPGKQITYFISSVSYLISWLTHGVCYIYIYIYKKQKNPARAESGSFISDCMLCVLVLYILVEKQDLWSAGAVRTLAAPQAPCWQAAATFSPPAATLASKINKKTLIWHE